MNIKLRFTGTADGPHFSARPETLEVRFDANPHVVLAVSQSPCLTEGLYDSIRLRNDILRRTAAEVGRFVTRAVLDELRAMGHAV